MPEYTENYNLELPELDDKYSIEKVNANTVIIDAQIKANADAIVTKQPKITTASAIYDLLGSSLPSDRVTITNPSGKITASTVTVTELGYLSGVTGSVQTQLNDKAQKSHTHDDRYYTESEIDAKLKTKQDSLTIDSGLSSSSTNPVQNKTITEALGDKANKSHNHDDRYYTESEVDTKLGDYYVKTTVDAKIDAKLGKSDNAVSSTKATQDGNGNVIASTYATKTELSSGLSGKANASHTHDERYYTESEIDTKLNDKLSVSGNAVSATKATQDGNGNIIVNTYATKTEMNSGLGTKQNKITISKSYPSGGNDGDLWAVIE